MTWASELPYAACGALPFRVLLKLADVASKDGTRAWRAVGGSDGIAAELGVSPRSVQRCLAELRTAGLIRPGDQRHVAAIRADRRPTVYDLALQDVQLVDSDLLDDENLRGDNPVDNFPRGDTEPCHGVTAAVAITSNLLTKTKEASHVGNRARVQLPCTTTGQRHRLSPAQGRCADCLLPPSEWKREGDEQ